MNKKILCLGEILLRFQAEKELKFLQHPKFQVYVGGSEANVAVALSQLNWKTALLSALPKNDLAEQALRYYHALSVGTDHIYRTGSRIATYFMEQGAAMRSSKIIYDRANAAINDLKLEEVDWEAAFEGVTNFHWSAITPALSANAASLCSEAVKVAKEKKCHISADLHFRKNLWQFTDNISEIVSPLIEASHTVTGDPFTWQQLTGMQFGAEKLAAEAQPQDFEPIYRNITRAFSTIDNLCMLVRKVHHANHHELSGVMLSRDQFEISKNQSVETIIDRVGGGDAFMAGVLYGLGSQKSVTETIDFATAISALKHTIAGDAFIGTANDVEEVLNQSIPGKINR